MIFSYVQKKSDSMCKGKHFIQRQIDTNMTDERANALPLLDSCIFARKNIFYSEKNTNQNPKNVVHYTLKQCLRVELKLN